MQFIVFGLLFFQNATNSILFDPPLQLGTEAYAFSTQTIKPREQDLFLTIAACSIWCQIEWGKINGRVEISMAI